MATPTPAQRRTPHQPAEPVRQHLNALIAAGMTQPHISAVTGISTSALYELLHGRRDRVKQHTATQILNLRVQPTASGGYVLAVGATRRLQALVAYGYPINMLAELTGLASTGLRALIRSTRRWVHANTRHRVAAVYERLSITPGPSQDARDIGQQAGWAVPSAWDDDIDDPAARPDGAGLGRPDVQRIGWVLDGDLPFGELTVGEQAHLFRMWRCREREAGRGGGYKSFARAFRVSEWQARQVAQRAEQLDLNPNPNHAAPCRTSERTAA